MSHDVYICYDMADMEISDALCLVFEENNIVPWTKSKNMSQGDSVDRITNAISESKCFVLLLSKNSKDTNFVLTETDIAFSRNVPILVVNVDNSKVGRNYEFLLENQTVVDPSSDCKKQLESIVLETSKIIEKSLGNVKINLKALKAFEEVNPYKNQNKIKKYLKIAIPIVVVVILIYFFVILPSGQNTTDDGVFSMNVTDVDVSGSNGAYKYTVHGQSYNLPSDSERYFMNIRFLDSDKNLVYEINSTADEFKYGVIGSCELDNDNVTHVGFKLTDINGKTLSQENYVLK